MLDYLIQNATIVDGSGDEPYVGNVGIEAGKITFDVPKDVCKDNLLNQNVEKQNIIDYSSIAKEVVNAQGLTLCSGFIDVHRHADLTPFNIENNDIELRQGITTVVNGNCGFSPFPHNLDVEKFATPIISSFPKDIEFVSANEFFNEVFKKDLAVNFCYMVGNGTTRVYVNGFEKSMSNEKFIAVKQEIEKALKDGAIGISLGIMYTPEFYYEKSNFVEIFELAKKYDVVVTVHLRGEGRLLLSSIKEVVEIATSVKNKLHISHFKVAGKANWGKTLDDAIEIIAQGRKNGARISYDAYPYTAGYTSLATLLPPWAQEGGIEKIKENVMTGATRNKIIEELKCESDQWDNLICSTGFESVVVTSSKNSNYVGKSISELARAKGVSSEDFALDLLAEEDGKTGMIFYHMNQKDVDKVICLPDSLIISDSLYLEGANYHPRVFGSFAKFFSEYVKTGRVSIQDAVKKTSYLATQIFKIPHRGLVREGYMADLVLIDLDKIKDNSTYLSPELYPTGVEYVFVNGALAVKNGKTIKTNCGKIIKR